MQRKKWRNKDFICNTIWSVKFSHHGIFHHHCALHRGVVLSNKIKQKHIQIVKETSQCLQTLTFSSPSPWNSLPLSSSPVLRAPACQYMQHKVNQLQKRLPGQFPLSCWRKYSQQLQWVRASLLPYQEDCMWSRAIVKPMANFFTSLFRVYLSKDFRVIPGALGCLSREISM